MTLTLKQTALLLKQRLLDLLLHESVGLQHADDPVGPILPNQLIQRAVQSGAFQLRTPLEFMAQFVSDFLLLALT